MKSVCVIAGSVPAELGRVLAAPGIGLVHGGTHAASWEPSRTPCSPPGGRSRGSFPPLTELRVMASMHERKATMAESDAFIARPGGWGTREEFFEILTWGQLGLHRKACGLLNVQGYFDPMIAVADSPEDLLDRLASYDRPWTEKWIDRERS